MWGIDFEILPASWKDCPGFGHRFASEEIEQFVSFPSTGFTTKNWGAFTSPRLKGALFHEIQHYIDRSLYQLVVGKWMVCNGRVTWGLIAYYYASFFAAQAAIRLKGVFFVKITYDSELNVPPTHRLEIVNLINDSYRIQKCSPKGEHQRVWSAFYEAYKSISSRPSFRKFAAITTETDPEMRLVEMHRRHILNYKPGGGYLELVSADHSRKIVNELKVDGFKDISKSLIHDDLQLEVRAFLRLELCLSLLSLISSQSGVYAIHHPKFRDRRINFLREYDCPATLKSHLVKILT